MQLSRSLNPPLANNLQAFIVKQAGFKDYLMAALLGGGIGGAGGAGLGTLGGHLAGGGGLPSFGGYEMPDWMGDRIPDVPGFDGSGGVPQVGEQVGKAVSHLPSAEQVGSTVGGWGGSARSGLTTALNQIPGVQIDQNPETGAAIEEAITSSLTAAMDAAKANPKTTGAIAGGLTGAGLGALGGVGYQGLVDLLGLARG